jgi:hypothetical protein
VYCCHWCVVQFAPLTLTDCPTLAEAAVPVKKTFGAFTSHAFVPSAPPHGLKELKLR